MDHKPVQIFRGKDRGMDYGTRFHAEMQRIDFSNPQSDDRNVIVAAKIVREFVAGMKVLREVPFLRRIERDGAEILVQGIIDLLAVADGRAVMIDFKTTKASEARLRELYKSQLETYTDAAQVAIGIQEIDSYIYSTHLGKLILV